MWTQARRVCALPATRCQLRVIMIGSLAAPGPTLVTQPEAPSRRQTAPAGLGLGGPGPFNGRQLRVRVGSGPPSTRGTVPCVSTRSTPSTNSLTVILQIRHVLLPPVRWVRTARLRCLPSSCDPWSRVPRGTVPCVSTRTGSTRSAVATYRAAEVHAL